MNKLSVNPPYNSRENSLITIADLVVRFSATFLLKEVLKEVGRKAGEVAGQKLVQYLIASEKKVSINSYLISIFPKDLQAILEDMQKRWIKKQYSPQKIKYLTFRYLFDMLLGYVKSQIENIWLPKSDSTSAIRLTPKTLMA